jgi:tight adherence protein C
MSSRDLELAARVSAARGIWPTGKREAGKQRALLLRPINSAAGSLGRMVLRLGLLSRQSRSDMQTALSVAGFSERSVLPLFIGIKVILMIAVPIAMGFLATAFGRQPSTKMAMVGIGFVVGLLGPDRYVQSLRTRYVARLEQGLPDALDLLVICAQAGLSLSPAMGRVAAEMVNVHPAVARELALTVRELEILPSAAEALHNLARRTGLPTLDRLGRTLAQTLQYGTPLTDALRNLAAETRQQVLTRFEGRAAQLPVLLTLPMILFNLPCVFIIAGGPAVLQVIKTLSN